MRNVYLLAAAQALAASGTFAIVLLGGILGAELAPRPEWATLPVSMGILGVAATTIPAALLMQRIGRKRTFILGAVLAGLSSLGVAWAVEQHNFAIFCAAIFVMGANLACVHQYRFAAIEYLEPERAGIAVSIVMCGMLLAAMGGPQFVLAARGWLMQSEYAGSFLAVSLLYVGAVILLTRLGAPRLHMALSHEPARPLSGIARHPAFVVAVLGGISGYAVMSFIMTATPLSMHVVDGLSVEATTWVIQSHLLAMFVPSLASGWLVTHVGVKPMMALGVILMSLCITISALGSHHVMHYWWGLVLLGAGWNLLFVAGTTLLTTTYRPSERFRAQGVNDFAVFGSQAIASLLAGPAIQHLGWKTLNLASTPLLIAMVIGLLALYRRETAAPSRAAAVGSES
ncbi:MAG TPA: MFS transporter [Steroidobacteraceae bacterium]